MFIHHSTKTILFDDSMNVYCAFVFKIHDQILKCSEFKSKTSSQNSTQIIFLYKATAKNYRYIK